jgi:DNA replication protein DnaC
VLSRPTHRFLTDLHAARANGAHARLLAKVLAVDLLVLDDFGLQPISPQGAQDLYQVLTERYEHRSMIVTSLSCRTDRATVRLKSGPTSSETPCLPAQRSTV